MGCVREGGWALNWPGVVDRARSIESTVYYDAIKKLSNTYARVKFTLSAGFRPKKSKYLFNLLKHWSCGLLCVILRGSKSPCT